MTTPPPLDRYVRAHDWARIVSLLALPPTAVPADVIAAIEAAAEDRPPDRDARAAALRACPLCDEAGWTLDEDGLPADPARKCTHGSRFKRDQDSPTLSDPKSGNAPRSFDEPIHPRDTEETDR